MKEKGCFAPPNWLVDDFAKKEFKKIISIVQLNDFIGDLDIYSIGGFCNAFTFYCRATNELKTQPSLLKKEADSLVKKQKNFAEEMRRFAPQFGGTLDSRLKLASLKIAKQEQALESDFGEI